MSYRRKKKIGDMALQADLCKSLARIAKVEPATFFGEYHYDELDAREDIEWIMAQHSKHTDAIVSLICDLYHRLGVLTESLRQPEDPLC